MTGSGKLAAWLIVAALFTVACAAMALAFAVFENGQPEPPAVLAPAHIVCVSGAETVWDYTVDSATVRNGTIETITLAGQTATFTAPAGLTCSIH